MGAKRVMKMLPFWLELFVSPTGERNNSGSCKTAKE